MDFGLLNSIKETLDSVTAVLEGEMTLEVKTSVSGNKRWAFVPTPKERY